MTDRITIRAAGTWPSAAFVIDSIRRLARALAKPFLASLMLSAAIAQAAAPVVSTVPVDPNDVIQPHDIISGKPTTLKGAVDAASVGATWTWDPGDGSPSVSGIVDPAATSISQMDDAGFTPHYAIWIQHTYTGTDGDVFLATLTVTGATGEAGSVVYRMRVRDATITTEVNAAIDEALWFMHRNFFRFDGAATQAHGSTSRGTIPMGEWDFVQTGGIAQVSATASALNAFEANGYLETGPSTSPYTETVQRAMRYVLASLAAQNLSLQTFPRPAGAPDDPDTNGNGIGIFANGHVPPYQTGMAMDAIIASGTRDAVAATGPANVIGRTYGDIVQDMVDWYAWAQSDSGAHGGWQYGPFSNNSGAHDNSASGWAAIGLVAAEDVFGATVPQWVKDRNMVGLEFTDFESDTDDYTGGNDRGDGGHGYTNSTFSVWGPFGVTAAAMVQMTMDDIASTTSATPDERWIRSENYFRRHFDSPAVGNEFKNYYYALFNLAKAMRTAVPQEVVLIGTNNSVGCGPGGGTPGCGPEVAALDWYLDPVSGLARTVVNYQVTSGVNIGLFTDRPGNSQGGNQDEHNTPWATQILTRTLFQAGPVARATANPNPGASNSPILFDGSGSFHQDPARSLVSFEWDFNSDGVFDASGVTVSSSFDCPTLPVPCEFVVRLRVTDDNVPVRFADALVTVDITIPPRPPTAEAGGPYLSCANESLTLDGSGSFDVDEGTSESGQPPFDTITNYAWELDGVSPFDFDEAAGVTTSVTFAVPTRRDIALQVTDNTSVAFPTAQQPNLNGRDFTSIDIEDCSCIGPIAARTKPGKAQLVWQPVPGAVNYDILRSVKGSAERFETVAADHLTGYATYLDRNLINGTTYWYRVVPKGVDGMPLCAFSQAVSATPQLSRRARTEFVAVPDLVGLTQSEATSALMNTGLAVGDITFATSGTIPEGAVISTDPVIGTSVAEGSAVALVISLGPPRVAVPDVTGQTQANAEAALTAAGLLVGDVTEENSDLVPEGSVIAQDPPGGVEVVIGSAVNIVVSLGPVTVAVPDVVGSTQADGEAALVAAGLAVGDLGTQNSDTVPEGSIISQDPPAGTSVVLNTPVDIVVSLGPVTVLVPDVIGLTRANAEAAILAASLTVGTVDTQNSATVPAGDVINQSPGAGSDVIPGTAVNLVVSLGPVQVTVPDVVGLTRADAETALVAADLGAGVITEQNSLTVPAGQVISQDPTAGTTVDESSLVSLAISIGPRQISVPNVVGLPQAGAEAAIVGADLTVGTVTSATSPTVPAGSVISQDPAAGNVVDEQSAVDLVISEGPAQVTVPNVVGLSEADASAAILAADLQVGTVSTATSISVPAGNVISQDPTGGTIADEQSAVDLVVSLGPAQVVVPEVVGVGQAAAESAITGAGLVVGTVDFVNSDTVAAGNVISQAPVGGTTVDEGSAVNLVVSLGAADIQVPDVVGLSQAAAEASITGAGLTVGAVTIEPSFTVPAGDVISQNPPAGVFVADGSAVDLVVSDGPPPDDEPPVLTAFLDRDPPLYDQGETVQLSISASDNSGFLIVTYSLDGGAPQPAVLPVTSIDTSAFAPGSTHSVVVTAEDAVDHVVSVTLNFVIRDPNDTTPPVASISTPADLAEVDFITGIVGTASDSALVRYRLGLRRAGSDPNTFRVIAEGTASVTNGTLGQIDPTMLENGLYVVRLEAEDAGGLTTAVERTYAVSSEAKPGIMRIGFVDLAIPVTGVPIAIERNYDNRKKSSDDFGFGWSLQIHQGSYENNRKPGEGWQVLEGGGIFGLPCQQVVETKSHLTEVRLSEREWFRFKLKVSRPATLFGGCQVTVGFEFVDGTTPGATLQILDLSTLALYQNSTDNIVNDDPNSEDFLQPYNPKSVRLTTIDGRQYDFSATLGGITRLRDPNGNTLTIGTGGIAHSSGKGISFARDAEGRITQITDPNGETLRYVYDPAGDLVSFFDQAENETTFEYDEDHNLLVINDPLGNRARTHEYDDAGRLIAIVDANGNRVEFSHDLAGRAEVITDSRGGFTRLLYDQEGNITTREQQVTIEGVPVIATMTLEFDANGNETVIVDPDGIRTEANYNAHNLPLTRVVDPAGLGITQNFSYNSGGDLLTDSDPNGLTQTYTYDGSGNPTTWIDRDGFELDLTYSSKGLPTTTTDSTGANRSVVYNDDGQPTEVVDSLGNRTLITYDANGNRTSETVFRTIAGTLTSLTTTFAYDATGNLTSTVDPEGNETSFEYNAIGKRSATIDPLGRRTEFQYDAVGALVSTTYPDGTTETRSYDSSGNVVSETNRAGQTTLFEYDELNRPVRTIFADGTDTRQVYSPGGRLAATIDENGNRTELEYDAAGRLVLTRLPSMEDAESGATVNPVYAFEYDAGGRRTAMVDPEGSRTEYVYDVPNRRVTLRNPDGTERVTQFDAYNRVVSVTDEEGTVTTYQYLGDTSERLVTVLQPSPNGASAGPVTRFTYDELGNRLSQIDALGRTTTFAYDALSRLTDVMLPGGQSRTLIYDAVGNVLMQTDFNGLAGGFTYDSMNRLVRKDLADGSAVTYTYTPTGKRASVIDSRGTTSYGYDVRDRLTSVSQPDAGQMNYRYDAAGNLIGMDSPNGSIDYSYDASNRLIALGSDGELIEYAYRADGRLARIATPNGVIANYAYDSLGRVTSVNYSDGLGAIESYAYSYTPAGRLSQVLEADGSTVDYTYDGLGRLLREQRTGGVAFDRQHGYDLVGNRTSTVVDGVTTNFAYNANDQLLNDGTTSFSYDDKGNLVERSGPSGTVNYTWTPENRLASVESGGQLTTFGYDADGIRVSRQTLTGTVQYLVDRQNPTGFAQVIEELDETGAVQAAYTYSGFGPASTSTGADTAYYHADALRDTRLLSDESGAVTDEYTYSAYGELVDSTGASTQPYRYKGQQFDDAVDGYYLRSRYYDPGVARFLSRDPFAGLPQIPSSLHPYQYAANDPLAFYDPSGKFFSLAGFSVSTAISSGLRAINFGLRASTICRIKGRIKVFRMIWTLRSIGGFLDSLGFGVSLNANSGGVTGSFKLFNYEYEDPPPIASGDLKKAEAVIKLAGDGTRTLEFAGEIEGKSAKKIIGTWNPNNGQWSIGGEAEKEAVIGDLLYCGFVKLGEVKAALSLGGAVGFGGASSSADLKGQLKLKAFALPEFQFTVFTVGSSGLNFGEPPPSPAPAN